MTRLTFFFQPSQIFLSKRLAQQVVCKQPRYSMTVEYEKAVSVAVPVAVSRRNCNDRQRAAGTVRRTLRALCAFAGGGFSRDKAIFVSMPIQYAVCMRICIQQGIIIRNPPNVFAARKPEHLPRSRRYARVLPLSHLFAHSAKVCIKPMRSISCIAASHEQRSRPAEFTSQ